MTRVLIGLVVSLGLSLLSVVLGATLRQYFSYLSSDDEKVGFGAALSVDTLRSDHLGCYSYSRVRE